MRVPRFPPHDSPRWHAGYCDPGGERWLQGSSRGPWKAQEEAVQVCALHTCVRSGHTDGEGGRGALPKGPQEWWSGRPAVAPAQEVCPGGSGPQHFGVLPHLHPPIPPACCRTSCDQLTSLNGSPCGGNPACLPHVDTPAARLMPGESMETTDRLGWEGGAQCMAMAHPLGAWPSGFRMSRPQLPGPSSVALGPAYLACPQLGPRAPFSPEGSVVTSAW